VPGPITIRVRHFTYFRADVPAKYGDVKAVLDQISAAGIQDVAFITYQREPEPGR